MTPASYSVMDEALEILSAYGPDLSNGLTSHAPMVTEALCASGRPEAVIPWIERYRPGMLARPAAGGQIGHTNWREALGQGDRFGDWSAFFADELHNAAWREVLDRWVGRLAPGICASATHGVIRVGHAVRSLAAAEVERRAQSGRINELADALASWAYAYQQLPTSPRAADRTMQPREAITHVAVVPPDRRRFSGTITSSLEALSEFPNFAPVIGLLDVGGDASRLVAELTDVFARVYLGNTHDVLTAIVFIHGVTSVAALGNMLPYLGDTTARTALRFAWQAGCGLYAAFGSRPTPLGNIEEPRQDADTLVDMAIAHGDEHAIKFTVACLQQHALNPSPAYLAAARNVLDILPRA